MAEVKRHKGVKKRHKGAKAQRRGTKEQRHKEEAQRSKGTKAQSFFSSFFVPLCFCLRRVFSFSAVPFKDVDYRI